MPERRLRDWAQQRGYRIALAGISLLEEVRAALEERRERGEIDAAFFRENLRIFKYLEGCPITDPRTVILVALPRPAHLLRFAVGGDEVETLLPPTYVRYRRTFEEIRDGARAALDGTGFGVEIIEAPLKALGERLGLLAYGRNNVGYVQGLGSYIQLVGLVSDIEIEKADKIVPAGRGMLERCRKCRICVAACPTGAIDLEHFLLQAEKCYTLFSESLKPIPEDLLPPSPRCLVGCLRCQEVCPENKGRLKVEEAPVSFTEAETNELFEIARDPGRSLRGVRGKLRELGLSENPALFGRNLKQMLELQAKN